jgi:colicin import membrane protein
MTQPETSALFSLKELMKLEAERVREETELEEERIAAEERARLEAEQLLREQELAEARRAEELRQRVERERRDEAVRLEARREAELERVRCEAEHQARLESEATRLEHERKLAAIAESASHRRLVRALRATLTVAFIGVGCSLVVYFVRLAPEARRKHDALDEMVNREKARGDVMREALRVQEDQMRNLEQRLANEEPPSGLPLASHVVSPGVTPPRVGRGRRIPGTGGPPKNSDSKCTCDEHDPLCGCFKPR